MTNLKEIAAQNQAMRGAQIITRMCELAANCDWCHDGVGEICWYVGFGGDWHFCRYCEEGAVRYFDQMTELLADKDTKKREAAKVRQLRLFDWGKREG